MDLEADTKEAEAILDELYKTLIEKAIGFKSEGHDEEITPLHMTSICGHVGAVSSAMLGGGPGAGDRSAQTTSAMAAIGAAYCIHQLLIRHGQEIKAGREALNHE